MTGYVIDRITYAMIQEQTTFRKKLSKSGKLINKL